LVSTLWFLSSCSSVALTTHKEPEYGQFIDRVALVINTGRITMWFGLQGLGDYLSKNIEKRLREIDVDSKVLRTDGFPLHRDQIEQLVANLAPNQILGLQPKEGQVVGNEALNKCLFDVVLYDMNSKQRVWEGELVLRQVWSKWGVSPLTADRIVDELIRAMRKDSLVR